MRLAACRLPCPRHLHNSIVAPRRKVYNETASSADKLNRDSELAPLSKGPTLGYNRLMVLGTIADITPNGAAVALSATEGALATWIKLTATGATIRVGDANVGAARGVLLASGVPFELPRGDFDQQPYPLTGVYVYGTGTDKVSITYGI